MQLLIRNLSKTYANGVKALDNVSLTIPHGMYGLLGPNGAGKTTRLTVLHPGIARRRLRFRSNSSFAAEFSTATLRLRSNTGFNQTLPHAAPKTVVDCFG
jgi:ABC-type phosphate/phosphonate transport system ATPase subunit